MLAAAPSSHSICINLLDFNLFEGTAENHHRFMLTEAGNPELVMTEDLQIHFVELTKPSVRESHLKQWTQLIENAGKEGEDMKVLLSKDRVLSQTYAEFERCTQDQEVREMATRMQAKGLSPELIHSLIGIPLEELLNK